MLSNYSFLGVEAHIKSYTYEPAKTYSSDYGCDKLMKEINDDAIRSYAHQFWEEAGKPEGKDKEFWKMGHDYYYKKTEY